MTNYNPLSTADIPKGSSALPAPVLVAYKNLLDVCRDSKVPLRTLFYITEGDRMIAAANDIAALNEKVRRQRKIIADLERQLGIDEL